MEICLYSDTHDKQRFIYMFFLKDLFLNILRKKITNGHKLREKRCKNYKSTESEKPRLSVSSPLLLIWVLPYPHIDKL